MCFPDFLTPVPTQLFFPKPPTTFLTCFCRGERRKYAENKVRLNWGSNSQPPGHVSDTLTTEPPRRGWGLWKEDFEILLKEKKKTDDKQNLFIILATFNLWRTNTLNLVGNILNNFVFG